MHQNSYHKTGLFVYVLLGQKTCENIISGKTSWLTLFEPYAFFQRYKYEFYF
jgi:poly(A) polymerase Pap1